MKNVSFLLFIFLHVFVYGQKIESKKLRSDILNQDREILIYTPEEYDFNLAGKFEVIFVFDAQNRAFFDFVHSSLSFIKPSGTDYIVVGITSPYYSEQDYGRNNDMLPPPNHLETVVARGKYLGNADNFLGFIDKEVIPYLEINYRTLPKRIAVGHSNSATFILYSLLKKPGLFDTYLAVSPNFEYDREQIAESFKNMNPGNIEDQKFVFLSNANEDEKTGFKGWREAREKAYKIFHERRLTEKIFTVKKEFLKESHWSSFAPALLAGFDAYFKYQYYDYDRLSTYIKELHAQYPASLSPDEVNQYGYNFFNAGKIQSALKILLWANEIFPDNLNLYDSVGEMYQNLGNKKTAMKYYKLFEEKLESQKENLDPEEYQYLKESVQGRMDYLSK